MQARLTNRIWASDYTRASVLINYLHEFDPDQTVIGLRFTIQELPGPLKLGGQLDIRMTFDEAKAFAQRIMAKLSDPEYSGQNKPQ